MRSPKQAASRNVRRWSCLAGVVLAGSFVVGSGPHAVATLGVAPAGAMAGPAELAPAFEPFRPLVGYAWEIDGAWTNGNPLRARNEYRVGLNGNFVTVDTFVSDGDGGEYQRYHSIVARHPSEPGVLQIHGFTYDGSVDIADMKIIGDGAHPIMRVTGERKLPDGTFLALRQEVQLTSDTSFAWKVWSVAPEGESQLMDGTYNRGRKLD
ncbi:MAG: hypothetical protein RBS39_07095 [Phycisphaerales bacterium]|jgi:hypothetical protein|nr:hypothetical protein [Phycisphaerales bacterium]